MRHSRYEFSILTNSTLSKFRKHQIVLKGDRRNYLGILSKAESPLLPLLAGGESPLFTTLDSTRVGRVESSAVSLSVDEQVGVTMTHPSISNY